MSTPYLHTTDIDYLRNWFKTVKYDPTAVGTATSYAVCGIRIEGIPGANGLLTVVRIHR